MNSRSNCFRTLAAIALFLLISSSCPTLAYAGPTHFESYAKDIASEIKKQKKSWMFPRILVIDFSLASEGMDSSGPYLANDLSSTLSSLLPSGTIISRTKLQELLDSRGLTPNDLESNTLAFWAAEKLDANEILTGRISSTNTQLILELQLLRVADTKQVEKWSLNLNPNDELGFLIGKPLPVPERTEFANLPLRCSSDGKEAAQSFLKKGGTLPKGIYMPNPPYSEKARKEKLSGQRQYDAYLNSKGELLLVIPHHPLRPEFDDIALETISTWRLQPATLEGKPVPVCVTFEITWRLY